MIAVIFLNFILTAILLRSHVALWRESLLATLCCLGAWVVVSIEVFSYFHAVTPIALFSLNILYAIVVAYLLKCATPRLNYSQLNLSKQKIDLAIILMVTALVIVFILELITIIVSLPNSWDAMTYHLPRVVMWNQYQGVCNFPTNEIRQLFYAPGNAIFLYFGYVFTGSLDWAGILQWISGIGCCIAVSMIVRELGGKAHAQLMAALLVATLPMTVLQSVSSQNHLSSAMWVAMSVYFMIRLVRSPTWMNVVFGSIAISLSILVKESSLIFIAPFFIWMIIRLFQYNRLWLMKTLLVLSCMLVILNGHTWFRTYQLFAQGVKQHIVVTNASISINHTLVNVLRNAAIHVDVPYLAPLATRLVVDTARALNLRLGDPDNSFSQDEFIVPTILFDEDYASCFPFLILCVFAAIVGFCYRRQIKFKSSWKMVGLIIVGGILFSMVVKFQPWHMRFLMTLWILLMAAIAVWIEPVLRLWQVLLLTVCLLIGAVMTIVFNRQHPWQGDASIWNAPRLAQMYYKKGFNKFTAEKTVETALSMMNCSDVGYITGGDVWTYPMFRQIQEGRKDFKWTEVGVVNPTSQFKTVSTTMCAVVGLNSHQGRVNVNGREFKLVWQSEGLPVITLYIP